MLVLIFARRHDSNASAATRWGCRLRRSARGFLALLLISLAGCKTTAPIHVWRPPKLAAEPATVAFMGVTGPAKWSDPIELAILEKPPKDWTLIAAERLDTKLPIRLVSGFDDQPNDMAISAAARDQGLAYLLHGQVLQATGHEDRTDQLTLSWRLTGLQPGTESFGMPVFVDERLIADRYPHLLLSVPDPAERIRRAAVMETSRMLQSSVHRQTVTLASPRMLPASRRVRRGNMLATSGNWPMAEQVWMSVLEDHPRNPAALINASIAAAARQDFKTAKERVTQAVRRSVLSPANKTLAQQTLVWIELRQRDYHEAFDLPPPEEGWRVSANEALDISDRR